jgi:energy-coupling factor transporter ATP-binding protein EcfA2
MGQHDSKLSCGDQLPMKILVLGIPGSGKSTLLMQIRSILNLELNEKEMITKREEMRQWAVQAAQKAMKKFTIEDLKQKEPEAIKFYRILNEWSTKDSLGRYPEIVIQAFYKVIGLGLFKQALQNSDDPELVPLRNFDHDNLFSDTASIDFDLIKRIYIASKDLNELRITSFNRFPRAIRLIEIPGPRFSRKKWIQTVERFHTVIFIAPANVGENQELFQESLTYFESVCNSRLFKNARIILAFSKLDLLLLKLHQKGYQRGQLDDEMECLQQRYIITAEKPVVVHHLNLLDERLVDDFLSQIVK